MAYNGPAIVGVFVAESTGGRGQNLSYSFSIFIRPKGAKHGAVFAIMVDLNADYEFRGANS